MRITSKGQVTIPIEIREKLGASTEHRGRLPSCGRCGTSQEGEENASARSAHRRPLARKGHSAHEHG